MNRKQRRKLKTKVSYMKMAEMKPIVLYDKILTAPYSEYDKIFELSDSVFEKNLFPSEIRCLGDKELCVNPNMSFTDTLNYALWFVEKFFSQIDIYIKLKNIYENNLFSCNYRVAEQILLKIEDKVGVSLWSCGQKLILAEQEKGLEGNKRLLSEYLDKISKNGILSTLLDFFSYRAEKGTSLNNYNEKIDKFLKKIENNESVYYYFSYKLRLQKIDFDDDMKFVFQIDSQISAIDLYNSLIEILQREFINNKKISNSIWNKLKKLNLKIHDFRIDNLLAFKGHNVHPTLKKDALKCIELYTLRKYETAIDEISKYLTDNYNDFQMWVIYIKCHILSRKKFENNNEVICDLYSLYSLDEYCMKAKNRLMFALKKYNDTTWHYKLLSIISRKLIYSNSNNNIITLSLLNEHTVTPKFISLIPNDELKDTIFNGIGELIPETLRTLSFNGNYSGEFKECFRDKLYHADYLRSKNDYEKALECLNSIKCEHLEDILYIQEKILRLRYAILYEAGKYEQAMITTVNAYFQNNNLIKRCDLEFLNLKLKKSHDKKIYARIEYPIFTYLVDELDTKNYRIAFSNFLDAQNILNFDELINRVSDEPKVIFSF